MGATLGIRAMLNSGDAMGKLKGLRGEINSLTKAGGNPLSGFAKGLRGNLATVSALTAGFLSLRGAIDGIKGATNTISDFEFTMAQVRAVVGDITDKEFGAMEKEARNIGKTTMFSATQAGTGLLELSKNGFKAKQSIAALGPTMRLAQAASVSFSDAASIVTASLASFQIDVSNTELVVDVLAKAINASNLDLMEFSESMKYAGPIANSLGMGIADVSASLMTLSQLGVKGSVAGTGIRQFLIGMVDANSEAMVKLRKNFGVTFDMIKKAGTIKNIVKLLKDVGVTGADAYDAFGARGGQALAILLDNEDVLGDMNMAMDQSAGTAKKMADVLNNTLKAKLDELKSTIEELVLSAGDKGLGAFLKRIVEKATEVVRDIDAALAIASNMFNSGELGEAFRLTMSIGGAKFVNFFIGMLRTGFQILGNYLGGLTNMASDPENWKGALGVFVGISRILQGAVQLAMAELVKGGQDFVIPIATGLTFAATRFANAFATVANSFAYIFLGALAEGQKIVNSMSFGKLGKQAGVLSAAADGFAMNAKIANDSNVSYADTEKDVRNKLGYDKLHKSGLSKVGEGSSLVADSLPSLGDELMDKIIRPVMDSVKNFKPAEVIDESEMVKKLDDLIKKNTDKTEEAKKSEVDGDVGKLKPAAKDDAFKTRGLGIGAIVADSMQQVGGGGIASGMSNPLLTEATKQTTLLSTIASNTNVGANPLGQALNQQSAISVLNSMDSKLGKIVELLSKTSSSGNSGFTIKKV